MAKASGGEDSLALSEKKLAEALEHIERAKRCQDSNNTDGAQQEVTHAWFRLDEALAICPQNHRARFLLVSCAMNADDYRRALDEGLKIYHDLTEEEKIKQMNDSILHLSIAHAAKMLGELDDAFKFAAEATQLFADDPQPYMVLGELHMAADDYVEAEKQFRRALTRHDSPACKHPLNAQCVYFSLSCLGATLVSQGKYSEAEKVLVKASRQDGASTLALRHLVDVYHFQGRSGEAVQIAEHICELDPTDDEIRQKLRDIQAAGDRGSTSVGAHPHPRAGHGAGNGEPPSGSGPEGKHLVIPIIEKALHKRTEEMDEPGAGETSDCSDGSLPSAASSLKAGPHPFRPAPPPRSVGRNSKARSDRSAQSNSRASEDRGRDRPELGLPRHEPPKREAPGGFLGICCFERDAPK